MTSVDTTKTAKRAAADTTPVDPVAAMTAALFDEDVADQPRKDARAAFSALANAGRPWEQLPPGLKTAARADAARLLETAEGKADALADAGYHPRVAGQLLHDIGKA